MKFLKICISFTVLLLSSSTHAQDQSASLLDRTDIIIIVDESGSLNYTDPDKLRFEALEILQSRNEDFFRGSLLGFSDEVRFYTESANSVGKLVSWPEVCTAIPLLRNAEFGEFTDIKKALEVAYNTFQKRKRNYPGRVILFTDGRPEPDIPLNEDTEKFRKKYNTELDKVVSDFLNSGLRIYSIAFSTNADSNFLNRIADNTRGQVFVAITPADIAHAVSKVMEVTGIEPPDNEPNKVDLDEGPFEKEIEVSTGSIELRVEIFKNEPSDESPEIHITDPKGNERSSKKINNRIASIASILEPSPSGIWKVVVKGENVGKVTIKVSQLPGLRLEVISPEPKTEYKYIKVPMSVSLHRLSEKSSTENVQIIARIRHPEGDWAEVNMTKAAVSGQNWTAEYPLEQKGEHTVFFDVKIGEVTFSSGERVSFHGVPRPIIRVEKQGERRQVDKKTEQRFILEASNLFENIKYKFDHHEADPDVVHVELPDFTVSPTNGTANIPFTVKYWSDKPLRDEVVFSAILVPISGSQELKELLTVNVPLGPIIEEPKFSISAKDCKIKPNKNTSLSVRIKGESVFVSRNVGLRVADGRVVFSKIPSTIPMEPTKTGKTIKEVELLVGEGTKGLPPWLGGWEVTIALVDVGSGEELASTIVKFCGPMPLVVYIIVAAIIILAGCLLYLRYRRNFPPEAELETLTLKGQIEDSINLRKKTGFFKRKLTVGREGGDDIDIDKEATIFVLAPCSKGVLLKPIQEDGIVKIGDIEVLSKLIQKGRIGKIGDIKDIDFEPIVSPIVWEPGSVIIVDDDRPLRLMLHSEEVVYDDSSGNDDR